MSIVGQNTILNQYTPTFLLKDLVDGQIIKYDAVRKAFVNVSGGPEEASRLGDLLNVDESVDNPLSLQNGQALVYNLSTELWDNQFVDFNTLLNKPTSTDYSFIGLSDVTKPSLPDGYVLWDSSGTSLVYSATIPMVNITGILPLVQGGTGATTQPAAANAVLPDQSSNSGRYLTSNGTDVSWGNPVTSVSTAQPAAGLTITGGPITTTGTLTFALSDDLAAIEGLPSLGLATRTAANVWTTRTITGTTNRTIVTNGDGVSANPTIDIASTYVGQTSITTVGTIGTGTWQGTAVGATFGGTGQTVYAVGDILYADTTTTVGKLADIATGNALISGGVGVAPSWGKIGLTTHVTGTLPIANGGTGSTSQSGAANAVLPPQAGNAGKFLITDATNASWGNTISANLLFGTDNTYDIGTLAATRPRNLYAGNVVYAGLGGLVGAGTPGMIVIGPSSDNAWGGVIAFKSFDGTSVNHNIYGASNGLTFNTSGTAKWNISIAGHFLAATDNTLDIGATSVNRPRTIYAGTGVNAPTFTQTGNNGMVISPTVPTRGIYSPLAQNSIFLIGSGIQAGLDYTNQTFAISANIALGWSSNPSALSVPDLTLFRGGADALEQRRGTNAQTSRIYNTFTSASIGEWLRTGWDGVNNAIIATEKNGTGTARNLYITSASTLYLGSSGANGQWALAAGNLIASTDNTLDIGASAASRPRSVYIGTDITVPTLRATTLIHGTQVNVTSPINFFDATTTNIRTQGGTNIAVFNASGQSLLGGLTFSPDNTYDIGASAATRPRTGYFGTSIVTAQLSSPAATNLSFFPAGVARWYFENSTGSLYANTDNTVDIGASGVNRPRTIYVGTNAIVGGNVTLRNVGSAAGTATEIWLGPVAGNAMLNTPTSGLGYLASANAAVLTWQTGTISATGNLMFTNDNTNDIGAAAATRPRNIYAGTGFNVNSKAIVGLTTNTTLFGNYAGAGYIQLQRAADGFGWTMFPNASDSLVIGTGSGNSMTIKATWADSGDLTINNGLQFGTDNTYDIGTVAATRPRNIYAGGTITAGTSGVLQWTSKSNISSPTDSNILLRDSTNATFGLLQLGGTTSSFPALKRNGANLEARLADDSAYTGLNAGAITADTITTNSVTIPSGVTAGNVTLAGVTASALHRSPNAITSMFIYDTTKDSDGGAWTDRQQDKSWYNETLNGTWIGATTVNGIQNESVARASGGTLSAVNLVAAANGTTTGWTAINGATLSVVSGRLRVTNGAVNNGSVNWTVSLVSGKSYILKSDLLQGSSTAAPQLRVSNNGGSTWTTIAATISGSGTMTASVTGNHLVQFLNPNNTVGFYFDVGNFSLQEITTFAASGSYFPLATDGKFYKLNKNLLKWNRDLTNVAWLGKIAGTFLGGQTDPLGGTTAVRITATAATVTNGCYQSIAAVNAVNTQGVNSMWVRRVSGTGAVQLYGFDGTTFTNIGPSLTGAWQQFSSPVTKAFNDGSIYLGEIYFGGVIGDAIEIAFAQAEYGTVATAEEVKTTDQGTTEVFRGNKAKFPRQAAIVTENTSVTIYDLTELNNPMWMRFVTFANNTALNHIGPLASTIVSVAMLNGIMAVGPSSSQGITLTNFLQDRTENKTSVTAAWRLGTIAQRNAGLNQVANTNAAFTNIINGIAMVVLPDAPVDPVTGIQVPTIGAAGGTGAAILKHDGTNINLMTASGAMLEIWINKIGEVFFTGGLGVAYGSWLFKSIPTASTNTADFIFSGSSTFPAMQGISGSSSQARDSIIAGKMKYLALTAPTTTGTIAPINGLLYNPSTPTASASVFIGNTYNTGFMLGDVRRTWMSDTTAGIIAQQEIAGETSNFTTATTSLLSVDSDYSVAINSGVIRITRVATLGIGGGLWLDLPTSPTANKQYVFEIISAAPSTNTGYFGATNGGAAALVGNTYPIANQTVTSRAYIYPTGAGNGKVRVTFGPARSASAAAAQIGDYMDIIGISMRTVVEDRSWKIKPTTVYGTLTKTAVATAAQLVAYSGFSASNYLQEPYSADLDFGTGNWRVGASGVSIPANPQLTQNIAYFSNVFSASGWQQDGITVTDSYLTTGGRTYARLQMPAVTTSNNRIYRFSEITPTPVNVNTSLYVRKVAASTDRLYFGNIGGWSGAALNSVYDPVTQTFISGGTGFVIDVIDVDTVRISAAVSKTANAGSAYWQMQVVLASGGAAFGAGTGGVLVSQFQCTVGSTLLAYEDNAGALVPRIHPIAERRAVSGAYISFGINGLGFLQATAYDGTTTRTVTTTTAYNTAAFMSAWANYTANGAASTLTIEVNGQTVATSGSIAAQASMNARWNQLIQTEDFTQSAWTKQNSTVTAGTIDPNGGTKAFTFNVTAGAAALIQTGLPAQPAGAKIRVALQAASLNTADFTFYDGAYKGTSAVILSGPGSVAMLTAANTGIARITGLDPVLWTVVEVTLTATSNGSFYLYVPAVSSVVASGTLNVAFPQVSQTSLPYQRVGIATDFDYQPVCTVGQARTLDSAFPGSIAFVKLGATIPTTEQAQFMYAQESEMFQAGAQVCVPDVTQVLDLSYDEGLDKWVAISSTNESSWTGLVRTSTAAVPTGTFTKAAAQSGVKALSRITLIPGVDITIPSQSVKDSILAQAIAAANRSRVIATFDFDATTTQVRFPLPAGWTATTVQTAGVGKREGSTKDWVRAYDGFVEAPTYNVAPGAAAWVSINARRFL